MKKILHLWLLLLSLSSALARKDDLPLCPTNLQYFPQNLPMHCRMPGSSETGSFPEMPQFPTLPPLPESFYQSPPPGKQPPPIPFPIPPFPGMPMPGGQMRPPMGGPMPGPMPGMPGPMPMPVPIVGGPPHKMPVIVMPFYSPDPSFKKPQGPPHHGRKKKPPRRRKKRPYDSDTDFSSDETSSGDTSDDSHSSNEHGFWKGRRKGRRRMTRRFNRHQKARKRERKNKKKDLLTPILQYVTKDGYVIFEKQISNGEAKDWLNKPKPEVIAVEEVKREENVQKSAEEPHPSHPPKADEEEMNMRNEEKSVEAQGLEQSTHKPRRYYPRKLQ